MREIYFIGIGPGDLELLTLKALKILKNSEVIIYPGSLINPEFLNFLQREVKNAKFYDSSKMNLEEIINIIETNRDKKISRLVSGAPAFYSALLEQIEVLRKRGYTYEIIPGVSSAVAGACKLGIELTWPDIAESVVFTRFEGKTGGANREEIKKFAQTKSTLVFFLSASFAYELTQTLLEVLPADTPSAILYKITYPDEKIFLCKLFEIPEIIENEKIKKTALIIIGKILKGVGENFGKRSKLYGRKG